MFTANIVVDHFNTIEDKVYVPNMKIQSNNIWFNSSIEDYPKELKMLVHCINASILAHALTTSFSIPMKWLSLIGSTVIYNNTMDIITFQVESKGNKRLNKKKFTQILSITIRRIVWSSYKWTSSSNV